MNTERMAAAVVEAIAKALEPRDRKIAALEAKLGELETKQTLHRVFKHNTIAHSDEGQRWRAVRDTELQPGVGDDWQLAEGQ